MLGRGFQAPSDTVNIATVGIGGMGASNTRNLMSQNIVDFSAPLAAESSAPPADRLISGNPSQQIATHFADTSQQFFAGTWSGLSMVADLGFGLPPGTAAERDDSRRHRAAPGGPPLRVCMSSAR